MYLKVKDSFRESKQGEARHKATPTAKGAARRSFCAIALSRCRLGVAHGRRALSTDALNYTRDNGGVLLRFLIASFGLLVATLPVHAFAKLTPQTTAAFDAYVGRGEARMNADLQPGRFLHLDARPELKNKVRAGEPAIVSASDLKLASEAKIPDGMIQDWIGMMFMPGATLEDVKSVLQDYAHYKNFYTPKVMESKEISRGGDDYDVFLQLYEKHVLTVVLNTTYHVEYKTIDPQRMEVVSRSTRIAEMKGTVEEPPGNDTGFLWRLNSYWRFEAADGGVYAQCEAISLSRDVPLGLGWMIKGFLEKFPKESMINTLRGTRAAVAARH